MHADPTDARGRLIPAAVTLPSLLGGGVVACLGTIFTEAIADPGAPDAETGPFAYPADDPNAARISGLRQLKLYQAWRDAGLIELIRPGEPGGGAPLRVGILMECADPIVAPEDLAWWAEQGVIAIGLTWAMGSRYAGGNMRGAGLSSLGRELIAAMDELGVVHDASHLSPLALDELFETTDRLVIASHSNCRALVPGDDPRHLPDDAIAEIARRGGIVGINLFSLFVDGRQEPGRAPISAVADHIERVCEITGSRAHVGLGSDMDGGFPASRLPEGINLPADLVRITDELAGRGWSDADTHAFAWANWARMFGLGDVA